MPFKQSITFRLYLMRGFVIFLMAMVLAVAVRGEASHGKVGLVLSGGGAKGIAHIGVIQAL